MRDGLKALLGEMRLALAEAPADARSTGGSGGGSTGNTSALALVAPARAARRLREARRNAALALVTAPGLVIIPGSVFLFIVAFR
jgi:hypothetical protein